LALDKVICDLPFFASNLIKNIFPSRNAKWGKKEKLCDFYLVKLILLHQLEILKMSNGKNNVFFCFDLVKFDTLYKMMAPILFWKAKKYDQNQTSIQNKINENGQEKTTST